MTNTKIKPAPEKVKKPTPLTKGQITETALMLLKSRNCEVWRQNNVRAVRGRTFTGRKGLPDIIGFHKQTGVFVVAEVKTLTDKLSDYQITFLTQLKAAGGLSLLALQRGNEVVLQEWLTD